MHSLLPVPPERLVKGGLGPSWGLCVGDGRGGGPGSCRVPSSRTALSDNKAPVRGEHSQLARELRTSMPRMEATVNTCLLYLSRHRTRVLGFCQRTMETKGGREEAFVNLDWAPQQLKADYPPAHIDCEACGASPIVLAFWNGQLCRGPTGPWCTGSASWLIVKKGPVLVVGIDLDQCIKDACPFFMWTPLNTERRHSMHPAWGRSDPPLHPHTHVATLASSCTCVDAPCRQVSPRLLCSP